MNSLINTLPTEILRKIYQYINPIFDYHEYIKQIELYKKNKRYVDTTMLSSCIRSEFKSLSSETNSIELLKKYYLKLENSMIYINQFIEKNPLFKRPNKISLLADYKYKTTWDTTFTENQIIKMNHDIIERRTISYWKPFYSNIQLKTNCELLYLLRYGDINDLRKSCFNNNIRYNMNYHCKNEYSMYLIQKLLKA